MPPVPLVPLEVGVRGIGCGPYIILYDNNLSFVSYDYIILYYDTL